MGNDVTREGEEDVTSSDDEENDDVYSPRRHVIGAVLYEGWMTKRARRSGRNWKRRWVQLIQIDSRKGALVYFRKKPKAQTSIPSGRIHIDKTTTCMATRKFGKDKFCIMLRRPNSEHSFFACASTRSELILWIQIVNGLVEKLSKTSFNRQADIAQTFQGKLHEDVSRHITDGLGMRAVKLRMSIMKKRDTAKRMAEQDKMRIKLLDLWKNEEGYISALKVLQEVFIPVLQKAGVDEYRALIFSHIEQILKLHVFFMSELCGCMNSVVVRSKSEAEGGSVSADPVSVDAKCLSVVVQRVADVFSRFAPFFLLYVSIVDKFPASQAALKRRRQRDFDFKVAVEVAEMNSRCKGLNFRSHLIKLVQRIPHYTLFLTSLIKATPAWATVPLHALRVAQAKMTEVVAKLDHNAQAGWKVRHDARSVIQSHRLLAHGHPEARRRASQASFTLGATRSGDDGNSSDDEEVDLEQFDSDGVDEGEVEDTGLELLSRGRPLSVMRIKCVLPKFNTENGSSPVGSPTMRRSEIEHKSFTSSAPLSVSTKKSDATSAKFNVDDDDFEWPEPPPTPQRRVEALSTTSSSESSGAGGASMFGLKKRRRRAGGQQKNTNATAVSSPRKGGGGGEGKKKTSIGSLAVHLRTLPVAQRRHGPMSPGQRLLNKALSSPQRRRASARMSITLKRHFDHVSDSSKLLNRNTEKNQVMKHLLGLDVGGLSKHRPLALVRRPITGRNENRDSLNVYMPKHFSMTRYYDWLANQGYNHKMQAPAPPKPRHWKDPILKAVCTERSKSTADGVAIVLEKWDDLDTGESLSIQIGPGETLMLGRENNEKLLLTKNATVEVMENGYSRQTNRDGSEIYQTPWGVRKIYLLGGTEVTIFPDGERNQKNPDGSEIRRLVDGTVYQVSAVGVTTIQRSDGTKVQHNKDGSTLEINSDGTVIQTDTDGTVIVLMKNGVRTQHHVDGTTISIMPTGQVVQESPEGEISRYNLPPGNTLKTEDEILQDLTMYPTVIRAEFPNTRLGVKFGLIRGHIAYVYGDAKRMGIRPGDRFWRVNGLDVVDPSKFECAGPQKLDIDLRFKWAVQNTTRRPIYIEFRRQETQQTMRYSMPGVEDGSVVVSDISELSDEEEEPFRGRMHLKAPRARMRRVRPNWRLSFKPKKEKPSSAPTSGITMTTSALKGERNVLSLYRRNAKRLTLSRKKISSDHDVLASSIPL